MFLAGPEILYAPLFCRRTKKKKVYVVSTQKRPVPLEHFLYTGNSNKTNSELFLIVDANKNFLTQGCVNPLRVKWLWSYLSVVMQASLRVIEAWS